MEIEFPEVELGAVGVSIDTLPALLRDIGKEVAAIGDRLPFVTDIDEVGNALCEIETLNNQVSGLHRQLLGATRFSPILAKTRQRTIDQYVAARTNVRPVTVRRARRLSDWLRDFDLFADETSILSTEHLEYLRTKVDNSRSHRDLVSDQQIFIDIATHAGWKEFVTVCESWLVANDPDGKEPVDQELRAKLSLRPGQGGRMILSGETDAISGQVLETAILDEAEKLRRSDREAGTERTDGQRRMAALVALAERGAARDDGTFSKPLINVVISQKLIDWCFDQEAGLIDPFLPIPVDPDDPDGRCELIDGTPLHPHQVMALLAKATVRRYVLDADSRVLDISYNARNFPEWIRTGRAVETRGRCSTHGCDTPHHWLQTDHVDPHSRGGETSWANSEPLCAPDNHAKTNIAGLKAWRDIPPPPRYRPQIE